MHAAVDSPYALRVYVGAAILRDGDARDVIYCKTANSEEMH